MIFSPCSLEILKDWINLIDEDGWVAREQILGEEARSKVSLKWQYQSDTDEAFCRSQQNSKPKCPTMQTHPLWQWLLLLSLVVLKLLVWMAPLQRTLAWTLVWG
jgi:hypothetical protein